MNETLINLSIIGGFLCIFVVCGFLAFWWGKWLAKPGGATDEDIARTFAVARRRLPLILVLVLLAVALVLGVLWLKLEMVAG